MAKWIITDHNDPVNFDNVESFRVAATVLTIYFVDASTLAYTYGSNALALAAQAALEAQLIGIVAAAPVALTLVSITPNTGTHLGGTYSNIVGTGFMQPNRSVQFTIGGAIVTGGQVYDDAHASVYTPPGTVGARDLVVSYMDANPTPVTLAGAFTYT